MYFKVTIEYCNRCKWQNRAVWYLQELLGTFDGKIHEVALKPLTDPPGTFKVWIAVDGDSQLIYQKRMKNTTDKQDESYFYDGFPDLKFLKALVRDRLSPGHDLGHIDRYHDSGLNLGDCDDCARNN